MFQTDDEHAAAHRVGDVGQSCLSIFVLASKVREQVAQRSRDQSGLADPRAPVVCSVLLSPECQNMSQLVNGVGVEEVHPWLPLVVLQPLG